MVQTAWWKFNGNGADSSGYRNNLDASNQTFVEGKLGRAIPIDGSVMELEWSDSLIRTFTGQELTVSFWVNEYSLNENSDGSLQGQWGDFLRYNTESGSEYRIERSEPYSIWSNVGNGENVFSNGFGNFDVWHHIVIRRLSNEYQLWVDGEEITSIITSGDMESPDTTQPMKINYSTLNSELDDLRFFDHAISRDKIRELSNASVAKYPLSKDFERFNDKIYEATGRINTDINKNDITVSNDTVIGNNSYSFNGKTSYIQQNVPDIQVTDEFSASMWAKFKDKDILEGFEDGNVDKWKLHPDSDFQATTDNALFGDYCGYATTKIPDAPTATYTLEYPSQISRFSFYYRETASQNGAGFRLFNSNGNPEMGIGTDNPQFMYTVDGVETNIDSGNGYNEWVHAVVNFDWDASTFDVSFEYQDSGYSASAQDISLTNGVDISYFELNDFNSTWNGGSTLDIWVDNISVKGIADPYGRFFTIQNDNIEAWYTENNIVFRLSNLNSERTDNSVQSAIDIDYDIYEWHNIIFTYNANRSDTLRFYIDGELFTTDSGYSGSINTTLDNIIIGNNTAYDRTFSGNMSNIQFCAKELSADEVSDIYNSSLNIDKSGVLNSSYIEELPNRRGADSARYLMVTDSNVRAYDNTTNVYINDELDFTLQPNSIENVNVSQGDIISADNPLLLGDVKSGVPLSWTGKQFGIPANRTDYNIHIYAPYGATVNVYEEGNWNTKSDKYELDNNEYKSISISSSTDAIIESNEDICAYASGPNDDMPLYPASNEIYGVPSSGVYMALENDTTIELMYSDGQEQSINLDRGSIWSRDTGSQLSGASVKAVSDKPIVARQRADGDGNNATPFVSKATMATHFNLANDRYEYLAFVGLERGSTVSVYDENDNLLDEHTVDSTSKNNHPTKLRIVEDDYSYNFDSNKKIICSSPQVVYGDLLSGNNETIIHGSSINGDYYPENGMIHDDRERIIAGLDEVQKEDQLRIDKRGVSPGGIFDETV